MKAKKGRPHLPLSSDHEKELKSRNPKACPYINHDLAEEYYAHCIATGANKKTLILAKDAVEYWKEAVTVWESAWDNEPSNYSF